MPRASNRERNGTPMSRNLKIVLSNEGGVNFDALGADLIEPWDEFYAPLDEVAEGFEIQDNRDGTLTLTVRVKD
jgi:hypothetical protein